jgi:hypothetical protein
MIAFDHFHTMCEISWFEALALLVRIHLVYEQVCHLSTIKTIHCFSRVESVYVTIYGQEKVSFNKNQHEKG